MFGVEQLLGVGQLGAHCEMLGTHRPFQSSKKLNAIRDVERQVRQPERVLSAGSAASPSNETQSQRLWEEHRVYEAEPSPGQPKFFANFPYPYMNGALHLGHSFAFSKAEFYARFQRMLGKNVLLPFGFHCTGMPIQAAADKLRMELKLYGNPPTYPEAVVEAEAETADVKEVDKRGGSGSLVLETCPEQRTDWLFCSSIHFTPHAMAAAFVIVCLTPPSRKGSKSKAALKTGGLKWQWEILQKMEIPDKDIPSFADPVHWLYFFPQLGMKDLQVPCPSDCDFVARSAGVFF